MGRESNEIAYSMVLRGQDGAEGTGEDIFKEGAENAKAALAHRVKSTAGPGPGLRSVSGVSTQSRILSCGSTSRK